MRFAGGCANCGNMAASLESLVLRLEAVATRLEALDGDANCSEPEKAVEKPEVEETIVKSDESMKNCEESRKENCVEIKGTHPSTVTVDVRYWHIQISTPPLISCCVFKTPGQHYSLAFLTIFRFFIMAGPSVTAFDEVSIQFGRYLVEKFQQVSDI